jgi:hypothetical protein
MNCTDNEDLLIHKLYFLYFIIIVSLPHLRPNGLLQSFAIVCRVSSKIFVHFFGN